MRSFIKLLFNKCTNCMRFLCAYFLNNHLYILSIFAAFLSLLVIFRSGFFNDDSHALVNANLPGHTYINQSISDTLAGINRGRLVPLHYFYLNIVAYFFGRHLFLYKLYLVINILINIVLMGKLIVKTTGSQYYKLLFVLFIPLFFQIYNYHDPITSYFGIMQLLLSLFIICLFVLFYYVDTHKYRYLILALAIYQFLLLFYELSYMFFPIIIAFLFINKKHIKCFIRNIIPICSLVLFNLIIVLIIRHHTFSIYSGIAISNNIRLSVGNFFSQMLTAFPLSHFLFTSNDGIISHNINDILSHIKIQDVYLAIFIIYLLFKLSNSKSHITQINNKRLFSNNMYLFFLGIGLYILPSIPYALSKRYQLLHIGTAYLNIYIQYYGLLIIAITCFTLIKSNKRVINCITSVIFYVLICIIIILNQQTARLYIDSQNNRFLYGTEIIENAIKYQNILKDITSNDILIVPVIGISAYHKIPMYANKQINLLPVSNFNVEISNESDGVYSIIETENTYQITSFATKDTGLLVFANINSVLHNNIANIEKINMANDIKLYIKKSINQVNCVLYKTLDNNEIKDIILDMNKIDIMGEDNYGILYSVILDKPAIIGSISLIENYQNLHLSFEMYFNDNNHITSHKMSFMGYNTVSLDSAILYPNTIIYGPYIDLKKGKYLVTWEGENLDSSNFDVSYHENNLFFDLNYTHISQNSVQYTFEIDKDYPKIEFRNRNVSDNTVTIYNLFVNAMIND